MPRPAEEAEKSPLQPQVLTYRSKLYGDTQQFGFSATDFDGEPKPLIVDLIPGTYSRVERGAKDCAFMCRVAAENGHACVAVRPCGHGNGTVYQGFGEVDVYEVIATVQRIVKIDPDRITLTGMSMGGAATWYHASHYPDIWAAAAPFCGYCDYQLWKKPGGTTFHRTPWEEFSWQARGAAYRTENLRQVPTRIIHGEWDRAVGGGVSVEHSRAMDRKLTTLKIPHEYHEVLRTGHSCRTRATWRPALLWLLKQKKQRDPNHVSLVVHTLRHHRSGWVSVEQQITSGQVSHVDAIFAPEQQTVTVKSQNVRRLELGPLNQTKTASLTLDDSDMGTFDFSETHSWVRGADGSWASTTEEIPMGEKRPGMSGPIGDIFLGPVVIVYGTSGSEEATHHNRTEASDMVQFFNDWNGGVHRGGIKGECDVRIPILSDSEMFAIREGKTTSGDDGKAIVVDAELLGRANLLFIGNFKNNAALAELHQKLPVTITSDSVTLAGKRYSGKNLGFFSVFPHPDGSRYVAMLSGQVSDAICWGSHMGLQLLPDFLVFEHERTVDWGFLDNRWRHVEN